MSQGSIPRTVSAEFMAYALCMTTQWVQKLTERGVLVRETRGEYIFLDNVQKYINYKKTGDDAQRMKTDEGVKTVESLKQEKLAVEVKEKKLKMMERLGQVIPIEVVGREWQSRMLLICNTFRGAVTRTIDIIDANTSSKMIDRKKEVRAEFDRILNNIKPPTDITQDEFDND